MKIGLVETLDQIRRELSEAALAAQGADVQFPVGQVTLELQVGVTRSGEANAGVNVWVLGLGASGQYSKESVHTITVVLDPPVDAQGRPIKVAAAATARPA
ncbi:trypco2 family protein [Dactylosporangium sp. NPDC050588]|uniref:trypco2 family protein n=1 Tax=Dactylosporangium sp. NPDC050588 TaxID=3157211 RepID=UPI0033E2801A